jgi:hypothetical protein
VASISDVAGAARESIGRYFSLVSALPSTLLVFYVFLLLASGGWSGQPDLRRAASITLHLGLTGIFSLIVASIGVALVFHPLQFAMVQLLEGYWGASWLAECARSFRMQHHWQRVSILSQQWSQSQDELKKRSEPQGHRQSRVVVITSFLDRWSDAEEVEDLV